MEKNSTLSPAASPLPRAQSSNSMSNNRKVAGISSSSQPRFSYSPPSGMLASTEQTIRYGSQERKKNSGTPVYVSPLQYILVDHDSIVSKCAGRNHSVRPSSSDIAEYEVSTSSLLRNNQFRKGICLPSLKHTKGAFVQNC